MEKPEVNSLNWYTEKKEERSVKKPFFGHATNNSTEFK